MEFPEYKDDYYFDRELLLKECLPALNIYKDKIPDYQDFFKGKAVSMLGFPTEDKVKMRKFILMNGGKAYHKRLDNPDIVVFGDTFCYYDMLNIYKHQQSGDKVVVISYETIFDNLEPAWHARIESFDKDEENKKKARKEEMSKNICDAVFLDKLNWVKEDSLSISDDIFYICGKLFIRNGNSKHSEMNQGELYKDIQARFGHVSKKNKNAVTCIIMGEEVAYSSLANFNANVKFVKYSDYIQWLYKIKIVNPEFLEFKKKYASSLDGRLRPYQQEAKDKLFSLWTEEKSIMLQMPTGAGKTILFSSVINDIIKIPESKILIIVHRTELIEQIAAHLSKYKIEHGVIASKNARNLNHRVQIASIQTLTHKNNEQITETFIPNFIIVDEAHHTLAKTYDRLWKLYPKSWKLGVTATPCRLNCATFETHFEKLIESLPVKELIKQGYLSDYIYYTDNPDSNLSKAIRKIKGKSATGDYKIADLLTNLNVEEHIKRLIACYTKYANGLKGIVYCISIEHAHNICAAYQSIGVIAKYIGSKTPKTEREKLVEDFKNGNIKVLVNVDIFSEGFDCPDVGFIQMARPTWSLSKYMQQVGRGLRVSPDKKKTIILDNAGMFTRFGLPTEDRDWWGMFHGFDVRNTYTNNIVLNNKYLRQKFANTSDMMITVKGNSVFDRLKGLAQNFMIKLSFK